MSKKLTLSIVILSFILMLCLSIKFSSRGVIQNNLTRNIFIPEERLTKLRVKTAYNEDSIFWKFEWEASPPSFYHDYLVYENGKWIRHGKSIVGVEPEGLYEDRLSFFLDDGSVENFAEYGGYITTVHDMRFMTHDVSKSEAQKHIGKKDVRKFLPETRIEAHDWRTLRPQADITALVNTGYFLDLWHWRAHRSNPIGYADDQHVSWYRLNDKGQSPYSTNWNDDIKQPKFMFNPKLTGQYAMNWQKLKNKKYTQNDNYYLSHEIAMPYDPNHEWKAGDVIPYRLLRTPTESRGTIEANGIWENSKWKLSLKRALNTNYPDDKELSHMGKYNVAFAIHKNATGSRWHYISLTHTLGLGRTANIEAKQFSGNEPSWNNIPWIELTLFYPGQVTWDHISSHKHAGYEQIKQNIPVKVAHDEKTLALYGIESEFRTEIQYQWLLTTGSWVLFFLATSWAIIHIASLSFPNHSSNKKE